MRRLKSCDTFVVLPPSTLKGCVIFGKNSDRPVSEVQEVVYVPSADHGEGGKLQCTYMEIPQVAHTHAVMLSKIPWMWGAEMGANEHGVCIGNEAIFTKDLDPNNKTEALIGNDLLRLGLERGASAKEAFEVVTSLLEENGQEGVCCEEPGMQDLLYFSSFLIADPSEAWIVETSGKHWAAENITEGFRNISNMLSIGTKIDAMSSGLKDYAKEKGYWDGNEPFDFAKAFGEKIPDTIEELDDRFQCGKNLLEKFSEGGKFTVENMMTILRDEPSGICRKGLSGLATVGSQVSVLFPEGSNSKSSHWFTATPNPSCSAFKPFVFCKDPVVGSLTASPTYGAEDPALVTPRFQSQVDRQHTLYKAHQNLNPVPGDAFPKDILQILMNIESQCIHDMEEFLDNYDASKEEELRELFKDGTETELKFYLGK